VRFKNIVIISQVLFLLSPELVFSGVTTFKRTLSNSNLLGLKEGDQYFISNNPYLGFNRMEGDFNHFAGPQAQAMISGFSIVRNAIPNEGAAVATISSDFFRYANAQSKNGETIVRQATMVRSANHKLNGPLAQDRIIEFSLPEVNGKVSKVNLQVLDLEKVDPVLVQTGIGNVTRTLESGSVVRETFSIAERSGQKPLRVTKEFELTIAPQSVAERKKTIFLKLDNVDPKTEQSRTISVEWKQDYNSHTRMDGFSRKAKLTLPDDVKGDIIGMVARPAVGGGFDLIVSTSEGKEYIFETVLNAQGNKLSFVKKGFQSISGGLASFAVKVKSLTMRQETNTSTRGLKVNGAGVSN